MTRWDVNLGARKWLVNALAVFTETPQLPGARNVAFVHVGDEGYYETADGSRGRLLVEAVRGEEILVKDGATQSSWWLSPASESERAAWHHVKSAFVSKTWCVRRQGKEPKTATELEAMILQQSGDMNFNSLQVRPDREFGWRGFVTAEPSVAGEYQAHVDRVSGELAARFNLKA